MGEALVFMLEENGAPVVVQCAKIAPPYSQLGAITPDQRKQIVQSSVVFGHYENVVDQESAFEISRAWAVQKIENQTLPRRSRRLSWAK